MKLTLRQNILHVIKNTNSIVQHVIQNKNGIIKHVKIISVKNILGILAHVFVIIVSIWKVLLIF